SFGFTLPHAYVPTESDIVQGFLLLALPQIPLSLGNSLLATERIAHDYFPERKITLRKLGFTYSLMNIIAPFIGGIPVCHGSGGLAGHYIFGARTGGSIMIYGTLYLVLGLFFSQGFATFTHVFPLPMLGVILLFESIALMKLMKDTMHSPADTTIALLVGLLSFGVPSGYLVGMIVGGVLAFLKNRMRFGV
ncbi:MAG: putative sulfate/molybdate transporter, partial [Bacteroidota bacterium]